MPPISRFSTPEEIDAEIARLEQEDGKGAPSVSTAEYEALIAKQRRLIDELAEQLERERERVRELSGLPSEPIDRSIAVAMTANNATEIPPDIMGRPLETDHIFPRRVKALGSNIDKWAKAHDVHPKKVRSWFRDEDPRRIPRHFAEAIEREMGVDEDGRPYAPATLATWPQGIR